MCCPFIVSFDFFLSVIGIVLLSSLVRSLVKITEARPSNQNAKRTLFLCWKRDKKIPRWQFHAITALTPVSKELRSPKKSKMNHCSDYLNGNKEKAKRKGKCDSHCQWRSEEQEKSKKVRLIMTHELDQLIRTAAHDRDDRRKRKWQILKGLNMCLSSWLTDWLSPC